MRYDHNFLDNSWETTYQLTLQYRLTGKIFTDVNNTKHLHIQVTVLDTSVDFSSEVYSLEKILA
jgi:hypothetical protein